MNKNIINVSGGKDSLATWLLAIERETENMQVVFADTGHEHAQTYEYVDYLERRLGPVTRVKADFSADIARKRGVVQTKWRRELPEIYMADVPGRWELKPGYNDVSDYSDEDAVPAVKTPSGAIMPLFSPPPVPAEQFSQHPDQGYYRYCLGIRGMTETAALEKTEFVIERALSVLHPTGIPFLDLCLWKGRFPSTRRRFCSEQLKHLPIDRQVILPALEDCRWSEVWSWQGVRADESPSRAKLPETEEHPSRDGLITYRPILTWTADEVFAIAKRHGIEPNPLYMQGMGRVGCMPCIHCGKDEMRQISKRFPEELERVAEWERLVSTGAKRQASTFMDARVVQRHLGAEKITADTVGEITHETHGIKQYVSWANTSRGGRQWDLINTLEDEDVPLCASIYGLCE
jgi:3'-phosphoadenosine 5'-phosphosulfate sulfotransferase (PAPS reductase)/FAD synthetase